MVSGIPCIPLSGTTGLAIGQDFASILNYTAHAAGGQCPFAAMSYLSLATVNGTIPGLANATDYGSGVEWVDGLTEQCLTSAVQLGIWMVDYYRDIPSGKHDDGLALLSTFIKQHSNPVYLRIGYEFDSSANRYDPGTFKEAYRYIARYFRSRAVSNAALVWHASGFEPRHSLPHMAWFPGADVVDWCGVSLFQQPYGCGRQSDCASMIHADSFARQCTKLGIPLMIAESTPFGGILDPVSGKAAVANRAGYVGDSWSQWFEPVLSYIERHDVRLWSYINCDWDSQPMWQKEHAPGIYWGDSRIEVHPGTMRQWKEHVLSSPRFLTTYPSLPVADSCEERLVAAGFIRMGGHISTAAAVLAVAVAAMLGGIVYQYKQRRHRSAHHYEAIP